MTRELVLGSALGDERAAPKRSSKLVSRIGVVLASVLATLLAPPAFGDLFVSLSNDTVARVSDTGVVTPFATTGLSRPQGVAYANDTLFVANLNGNIRMFGNDGADLGNFASLPNFQDPYGLVVLNNALYVAVPSRTALDHESILRFDLSGSPGGQGTVIADLGVGATPLGLAVDNQGNLLITDAAGNPQTGGGAILRVPIDASGTPGPIQVFATQGLSDPGAVAVAAFGRVYAIDRSSRTIRRYTADGSPAGTGVFAPGSPLVAPFGLAFNDVGRLFVTDQGNASIRQYSFPGGGTDLGVFASLPASPSFITYGPSAEAATVPEPSTWLLTLVGLAFVAAVRPLTTRG
jgi:hypothetical protein